MGVRAPAVAGLFYPGDPGELRGVVRELLSAASPAPSGEAAPRAVVAPHAGYVYSGPIAASAFRALEPLRGRIRRVVLLGPSHYVSFEGLALPAADAFRIPGVEIPLDRGAAALVADLSQVVVDDAPHAREHSLEVELPFLVEVLGDFALVPFACGEASPGEVAAVLERYVDLPETLVVVSTDLSHYLAYDDARRRDSATSEAITRLDFASIGEWDACGRVPLRGLLALARARGWRCRELDQRSSGDTAGPKNQVVGYGAYVLA